MEYFIIPQFVKNNILKENVEICANMILKNQTLHLYNINTGPKDTKRAFCKFTENSDRMFHTHPGTSYPYPSVEDILKVFKYKKINNSVIVSLWGIFQINKNKASNINKTNEDLEDIRYDLEDIKKLLNNIAILTINPEYILKKYNYVKDILSTVIYLELNFENGLEFSKIKNELNKFNPLGLVPQNLAEINKLEKRLDKIFTNTKTPIKDIYKSKKWEVILPKDKDIFRNIMLKINNILNKYYIMIHFAPYNDENEYLIF